MQVNINKKNEQWEHELRSCVASIGEVQEKDKAKTLKTLQKMHMQHEADVTDTKSAVREVQRISNDAVQSLKDNVKALAKEVLHNKGSIDDMYVMPVII